MNLVKAWLRQNLSNPQVVILGGLLIAGLLVIILFGRMLAPVLAAVVIAYLLDRLINKMEEFHIPRMPAFLIVFLIFMAVLVVIMFWLLPLLYQQLLALVQQIPVMMERGRLELERLPEQHPELISAAQIRQIMDVIQRELTALGQRIVIISVAWVQGLITFMIYLVLVPLLVFFMLKDKRRILKWLAAFLPEERALAMKVWQEVDQQIGNYVQGKFLEILIVWVVTYITFMLLNLPYAMLLSVLVGLSVLVPYVGAIVMTVPIGLIAYFEWGWSSHFIWVMAAYTIIQTLDGNVLAPILLSEVTNLHPVGVIVAILIFGGVWGFWGLVFAVPLATLVQAVIHAWPRTKDAVMEAEGI
jgi:putative permease